MMLKPLAVWTWFAAAVLAMVVLLDAGCGSVSPAGLDAAGGAGGGGTGGMSSDAAQDQTTTDSGSTGGSGGSSGSGGGQGGASCAPIAGMTSCRDGGACGLVHNGGGSLPYCSTCQCANGTTGSGCCECIYSVADPSRDSGVSTHTLPCCDQSCQ